MKLGKLCPDRRAHMAFSLEIGKLRHAFCIIYMIYFSPGYSSGAAVTKCSCLCIELYLHRALFACWLVLPYNINKVLKESREGGGAR